MNMLSNMLGGFINKEKETHDVIQETLSDLSQELGCNHSELFITITARDETFEPRLTVYRYVDGKPTGVREVTIKEILGED